jgi:long-chain acyl-CoA synthetase
VNLGRRFLAAAQRSPEAPALLSAGPPLTYGHLAGAAGRLARRLADSVRPGDRVVIVARNEGQFVASYLATLLAGAVAVPVEPDAPEPERARYAQRVGAALVLASPACADSGAATAAAIGAPCQVLDDEMGAQLAVLEPLPPVDRADSDVAALLFTSGTAGSPKAAMLTHGSLAANLDQMSRLAPLALGPADVCLGVIPFFHVFGLNTVLGAALDAGAAIVPVEHFHPRETLSLFATHRVTVAAVVPAMLAAWLAVDDARADACATVRLAVSGATFLPAEVHHEFRDRFGVEVHEGYGLTEASPVVASGVTDGPARTGSVGPPLPGVEVRLVDESGTDALADDPGEIWVRGPNVFAGYWDEPDATARVLDADGWLHTGDVAVADPDGWLRLVDRAKDLVIVSGFNVFPAEVEVELVALPGVADAAVVGAPDPRTGEAVHAFVVAEPGATLRARDLSTALAGRLARYKVPARFTFVEELPRGFGGKVLRRVLEDEARGAETRNPA